MQLDLDFVRAQFPGLAGEWAYLDNAGGSHVLKRVADRVADFMLTTPVQHGASYAPSAEAAAKVAEATARIAGMIGATRPDEIVMGPSTTYLFQQLARAMAPGIRPGDEIVVTNVDHESNIGPWRALEAQGAVIREWRVDPATLELETSALESLLGPRTRLVCVTHCSNILGQIVNVAELATLVHAHGAEICVDGVAYAPHRAVDVQALGVDYYGYSFYKTYGPHYAVLWGRYDRLLDLPTLNHAFIGKDRVPYKFQPGNVNYELAWGAAGIADYLDELGERHGGAPFDVIATHEEALSERLLGYLTARNDVRIIGPRVPDGRARVPTISFVVDGCRSDEIVAKVDTHRLGIRFGDFYARRLVDDLGLGPQQGVVRVSMVHYNTLAEVDRLIAALDEAL